MKSKVIDFKTAYEYSNKKKVTPYGKRVTFLVDGVLFCVHCLASGDGDHLVDVVN